MVFIYKFAGDTFVYNRLIDTTLVETLLEFIDENDFELRGEFLEKYMNDDEIRGLLNLLEIESYYYYQDAKLCDYDFEVAKSYTKRMYAIDALELAIHEVVEKSVLDYFIIAVAKDHLALQNAVDLKRTEAVDHLLLLEQHNTSMLYQHDIDLVESVERDFFDELNINWAWGIGYISKVDSLRNEKYIPLKGYQVAVTTEIKQYFTNAYEVIYTAFHIYRNSKDHRYKYKQKRAQRSYRFIVNKDVAIEVNNANEEEYLKRVDDAKTLQSLFNKSAEKSLGNLFDLNNAIIKPFLKDFRYYQNMFELVDDFVENDYLRIIQTYFLLGHINRMEYTYHLNLIEVLKEKIAEIEYLIEGIENQTAILTKQSALLKFFLSSTETAPKAGIIVTKGGIVQRTLMQIEVERGYSEEYRSDDSLKEFYEQQLH